MAADMRRIQHAERQESPYHVVPGAVPGKVEDGLWQQVGKCPGRSM